ncbi:MULTISPECIES: DUF6542 domain-containing protein [Streptacidiphilus]|uniref:DUF6542 domain-containing protein n=1 Tax=Streptacidiphilus cavernicola TaxID=3342716 RepID=A0ABV6UVZ5_9ACTN|nr:DUF6542 domain-containing protein [Streptacidiphilus jeojiense]
MSGPLFADEYPDDSAHPGAVDFGQSPEGRSGLEPEPRRPGRAQARRAAAEAGPEPGAPTAIGFLVLILVPLLGSVVTGSGLGLLFTISAVLASVASALLVARRALWWIVTATPVVVLLVALAARAVGAPAGSTTTAKLATDLLGWTAHAFPVMAIATGAAVAVTVVRAVRDRRAKEQGHG